MKKLCLNNTKANLFLNGKRWKIDLSVNSGGGGNEPLPDNPALGFGSDIRQWVAPDSLELTYTSNNIEYQTKKLYSATQEDGALLYYDRAMLCKSPYTLVQKTDGYYISELNVKLTDNGFVRLGRSLGLYRKGITTDASFYGPAKDPAVGQIYNAIIGVKDQGVDFYTSIKLKPYGTVNDVTPMYSSDFGIILPNGDTQGVTDGGIKELEVIPLVQWYCEAEGLSVLTFMRNPSAGKMSYEAGTWLGGFAEVKSVSLGEDGNVTSLVLQEYDEDYPFTLYSTSFEYICEKGTTEYLD